MSEAKLNLCSQNVVSASSDPQQLDICLMTNPEVILKVSKGQLLSFNQLNAAQPKLPVGNSDLTTQD